MRYSLTDLKNVKLEVGMLAEARKEKVSFTSWIENELAVKKQIVDSPYVRQNTNGECVAHSMSEIIAAKKLMKELGQPAPSTAFELLLEAHGIKAFGPFTDKVNKFFATGTSSILWPEWINTVVYYDQLATSLVEKLLPNMIIIDSWSHKKRKIEDVTTTGKFELGETVRGTAFPELNVELSEVENRLKKFGAILRWTYEAIEDMTLAQFRTEVLSIVSRKIGLSKTAEAIYVFINGDGVSTGLPAGNIETATVAGTIDAEDIMKFITATDEGYQIDQAVTPVAYLRKYRMAMVEMNNPPLQKDEFGIPLPEVYRWDGSYLTADYVLGVDSKVAGAWVTNDTMMMDESEKVITDQTINQVISIRGIPIILDAKGIGALDVA